MQQGQANTGTRNDTYDVIAVLYHALQGAENCQTYLKDAKQDELRQFFEQARDMQRQLADQGKQLLQTVLQNEGGGSAFGWQGQQQPQGESQSSSQFGSRESEPSIGGGQSGGGIGGGSSGF